MAELLFSQEGRKGKRQLPRSFPTETVTRRVNSLLTVTVLANLLDNAICAAAQAYPPEVYVRVRKTGEEYLLSVRNRVQRDVELPPDGQLPRTTRKEPGHGMGLSNVRDVLLRHGAEYTLSCRDNWFRFTCAVPTDNS